MDHLPSIACTDGREVALKLDKWKKWDPRGTIWEVADVGDDGSGTKDTIYNDAIFEAMTASMADGSEHATLSRPSQTELDSHANMPVAGRIVISSPSQASMSMLVYLLQHIRHCELPWLMS